MIDEKDKADLARDLRTFADRVEDGELEVSHIELWNGDTPAVKIEGMHVEELQRIHKKYL